MEVKKINNLMWEIQKTGEMRVPVRIFASENLLHMMQQDITLQQAKNMATLPGIQKHVVVLPDAHQGYGACIGGVAAYDLEKGVISPGEIGYDINCSVRLLKTNLTKKDLENKKKESIEALFRAVPSGVGKGTKIKIDARDMKEILQKGARWAVEKGYGKKDDLEKTENLGEMKEADANEISERSIERGVHQLGSLGSGNHFLELQYVHQLFDKKAAKVFRLKEDQIMVMIHCGSRGLGHQVASDFIKLMEDAYGFSSLPDRELINAPFTSPLGQRYWRAMNAAANFAFCNKQIITHWIRESMKKIFPDFQADVVYDICHNIAKVEEHIIDGEKKKVCVHRKGATRSFGPGNKELPEEYQDIGQPINIPGSMGTASWLLVGTKEAEELSFSSTAHGAGRMMSRSAALREWKGEDIRDALLKKGIVVRAGSVKGIAEEAPGAYKDVDEVVRVSTEAGIGRAVARLVPMAVMKG